MYDRQQTNPAEEPGHGRGDEVFGRYVLLELLGRGAMGEVWKAKDAEHNREVALKFLWGSGLLSERERERLRNEALTVIELHHTNIVRVYDYVSDPGGESAIVMEYVEGETLTQLLDKRPAGAMEVTEAESIVLGIAEALAEAHDHRPGVLHRDVKPDNIMVTKSGRVILMDFGLAETARETLMSRSVKAGVGLRSSGTPLYMSPQQQGGKKATEADDWYGLGATIYEMLTGRPPFFRGNIEHQIEKVEAQKLSERRRELEVVGGNIPKEWERAVAEMLSKKPEGRKKAGRELLRTLQKKKVFEVPNAEGAGKGSRGRTLVMVGTVTVLVMVSVGSQWWGKRGEIPEERGAATKIAAVAGGGSETKEEEEIRPNSEEEWETVMGRYRSELSDWSRKGVSEGQVGLNELSVGLASAWDELTREVEALRRDGGSEAVRSGEYPEKLGRELLTLWEEKKGEEWTGRVKGFREKLSDGAERNEDWKRVAESQWQEVSRGPYRGDADLYAKLGVEPQVSPQKPSRDELEAEWVAVHEESENLISQIDLTSQKMASAETGLESGRWDVVEELIEKNGGHQISWNYFLSHDGENYSSLIGVTRKARVDDRNPSTREAAAIAVLRIQRAAGDRLVGTVWESNGFGEHFPVDLEGEWNFARSSFEAVARDRFTGEVSATFRGNLVEGFEPNQESSGNRILSGAWTIRELVSPSKGGYDIEWDCRINVEQNGLIVARGRKVRVNQKPANQGEATAETVIRFSVDPESGIAKGSSFEVGPSGMPIHSSLVGTFLSGNGGFVFEAREEGYNQVTAMLVGIRD